MTHSQDKTQLKAAFLRDDSGIDTPVNNSCCAAASIIASSRSTAEGLIPHEKLREAATPNATLIAQNSLPAQPVVGYSPFSAPVNAPPEAKPGRRYWPADLTNVRPDEWAVMSPKHVAEFAGATDVWLLLEAAQKHIAELTRSKGITPANQPEPIRFISTDQGVEEHDLGEWVTYGALDHIRGQLAEQITKLELDKQTLQAENNALRKNSERYLVLRQADVDTVHNGGLFAGLTPDNIVISGYHLDERIDAVITAQKAVTR